MKKNVLFISIAAPPKTGPESLQVAKVLRSLNDKYHITLITERPITGSWSTNTESNVLKLDTSNITKIEVDASKMTTCKKIKNKLGISSKQFPDDRSHFWKAIDRFNASNFKKMNVIYSRSFPLSSSVAALKIAKKLKVPWIMHLSDPWTINPYHQNNSEKHQQYEKECFEVAAIISFTNENIIEAYSELYPEFQNKFKLFTNIGDSTAAISSKQQAKDSNKIRIIHSGNLYKQRTPHSIIKSISALSNDYKKNIELVFTGNLDHESQQLIKKVNDFDIKLEGSMSYEAVLQHNMSADLLLSIDANFDSEFTNLFMPSKLLDYMYTKKPILAITNNNSPAYNFVNNKYGSAFTHDNTDGIAEWLMEFIDNGGLSFEMEQPNEKYSIEYNVAKLNLWINDLSDAH